jgi:hypothetical protein
MEDVAVYDSNGFVLDQKRVENFADGKYLVWNVKGSLRITIKRVQGNNAIVNGLFLGSEVISSAPATLADVIAASSLYQMRVIGEPGQTFTIETSSDLTHWSPVETETLNSSTWDFVDHFSKALGTRIYRALLVE